MSFRKIYSLLLVFVMVISIAGCGGGSSDKPTSKQKASNENNGTERKYEGEKLVVWSFTDELLPAKEAFEEEYGCEVEVSITPNEDYPQTIKPVLESGQGAPDVFTAEAGYVLDFVNADYYENLSQPPYHADALKNDYVDYVYATGSDYDGNVRALSWQMTTGGIFYRRSVAKEVFGTDDPKAIGDKLSSLDKLFQTAEELNAAGYRIFSGEADLRWFTNPDQIPWVDENNRLTIPDSRIDYLDYSKRLRDEELTALATEWSPAWFGGMYGPIQVGESGEETTVFAYALPTWGLHYVLKTSTPEETADGETPKNPTWGDWAVTSGPCSYYWGGTWLGVYKNSKKKEMAWDFVKFIAHDEEPFLYDWLKETGDVTSILSIQEKYAEGFEESFLGGQNHVKFFIEGGKAIDPKRMTKYDKDLDNYWNSARDDYINGLKTKEEAIQGFKEAAKAAYPDIQIN